MKKIKRHILAVDDDSGHLNMLNTLLDGWGYAVSKAVNGEQAVDLCRERPYDLVLMDVRMPGKSGLEALREIKEYNPAIPVLIMTAYSGIEDAVQAIKEGAFDYLTKPLDFTRLKTCLHNIFELHSLREENAGLRRSLGAGFDSGGIIGKSEAMDKVLSMVQTFASSEATVLLTGESGTGKEVIARAIHMNSQRRDGPYIAFNCAAITESLFEAELFGHEKGAFTGADRRREGRFVAAAKGTLFLDEVGEIPLSMQAKLLRAIQEREVHPLGRDSPVSVDVRLIAATNRNLEEEVRAGRFREDLYYRINVVSLELPPLRERRDDIPLLAQHFLKKFAGESGKAVHGFTPAAMDSLLRYSWPGNVRELENAVERAVVLLVGEYVDERELPPQIAGGRKENGTNLPGGGAFSLSPGETLHDVERAIILKTMQDTGQNKSEAAKRLGISRKTLHLKLQKYEEEENASELPPEARGEWN
ncbi:MAG: sigma-54-dependent Fis family transcriptional regulator [Desulfovibrionaceae bacterium]|nr:sigma-54-dependent Fis family transcriptional regulator [Desulfovibrionaceae bacterium]